MQKLVKSIEALIKKAEKTEKSDDALKFSQAACNAANAALAIKGLNLAVKLPPMPINLNDRSPRD